MSRGGASPTPTPPDFVRVSWVSTPPDILASGQWIASGLVRGVEGCPAFVEQLTDDVKIILYGGWDYGSNAIAPFPDPVWLSDLQLSSVGEALEFLSAKLGKNVIVLETVSEGEGFEHMLQIMPETAQFIYLQRSSVNPKFMLTTDGFGHVRTVMISDNTYLVHDRLWSTNDEVVPPYPGIILPWEYDIESDSGSLTLGDIDYVMEAGVLTPMLKQL